MLDECALASSVTSPRQAWENLSRRDERGEIYLESRGLFADVLIDAEAVRFMPTGAPVVALRSLAVGGAIVNCVRRSLPADVENGAPKTFGLRGCPTSGSLVGDVDDIVSYRREAIVCEGVIDTLTAVLAWPFDNVFGAHGAGRMGELATEVAARCVSAGTKMYLVCDADPVGVKAGVKAVHAALEAGLTLGEDLHVVDIGGAHDLNEAWQRGWRP